MVGHAHDNCQNGHEVSTESGSDRVRLERNRPGCRVVSPTSNASEDACAPVATAPDSDLLNSRFVLLFAIHDLLFTISVRT